MKGSVILLCLWVVIGARGQGSCPPPLTSTVCRPTCLGPRHCPPGYLCCPTDCGGSICSVPVTYRAVPNLVKPGSCPAVPSGPWICSSTCSSDYDCRRNQKCCTNRCGAQVCQTPE